MYVYVFPLNYLKYLSQSCFKYFITHLSVYMNAIGIYQLLVNSRTSYFQNNNDNCIFKENSTLQFILVRTVNKLLYLKDF